MQDARRAVPPPDVLGGRIFSLPKNTAASETCGESGSGAEGKRFAWALSSAVFGGSSLLLGLSAKLTNYKRLRGRATASRREPPAQTKAAQDPPPKSTAPDARPNRTPATDRAQRRRASARKRARLRSDKPCRLRQATRFGRGVRKAPSPPTGGPGGAANPPQGGEGGETAPTGGRRRASQEGEPAGGKRP